MILKTPETYVQGQVLYRLSYARLPPVAALAGGHPDMAAVTDDGDCVCDKELEEKKDGQT